jgi:hypothetical protein
MTVSPAPILVLFQHPDPGLRRALRSARVLAPKLRRQPLRSGFRGARNIPVPSRSLLQTRASLVGTGKNRFNPQ